LIFHKNSRKDFEKIISEKNPKVMKNFQNKEKIQTSPKQFKEDSKKKFTTRIYKN